MAASPNLKLRYQAAANPQDVECGSIITPSSSLDEQESRIIDDEKNNNKKKPPPSSPRFLSDLSPFSRRIIRFVTRGFGNGFSSTHRSPQLPDQFTSECIAVTVLRILPSLTLLFGLPFLIWDAHPQQYSVLSLIKHFDMVWSSLLHTSIWPIVVMTLVTVVVMPWGGLSKTFALTASCATSNRYFAGGSSSSSSRLAKAELLTRSLIVNISQSNWKISLALSFLFVQGVVICMTLQMGAPSILWNPFMWGWYHVYLPQNVVGSLKGACLDVSSNSQQPLCLSEQDWDQLSSGKLSSWNQDDVRTVQRGLDYLRNQSGGLIVNALARNVADSIPALKQNMDTLAPFFRDPHNKLSLVVFENDSNDGTRQLFKQWAKDEKDYSVDIIGCGPTNPDCELGEMDRYDNMNLFRNPKASGVGKLGEFRQIILEYILGKEEYNDFSHMIILDVDLGTSISPLGLLHTLGLEKGVAQDYVVASSSSQVWPGTMGTIIPPYDLSAFRPKPTEHNSKVRKLHTSFCHLMPPGDRWRNMCEACSPMQLFMILQSSDTTVNHEKAYEVESAFNGLTIYPMSLIRNRGKLAQYDSGDDNQRCEHVGFHLSLQKSMYVNPKWSMNLKPSKPGGPTGYRAITTLSYAVIGRPNVMFVVVVANILFCFVFVAPLWMIGISIKGLLMLMNVKQEKVMKGDNRSESLECGMGMDAREL